MTVYVDNLQKYPIRKVKKEAQRYGSRWCHMATDGDVTELHEMAEKIGLKREHFQDRPGLPHYDLTPRRREKALIEGAVEISGQRLVNLCKKEAKSRCQE